MAKARELPGLAATDSYAGTAAKVVSVRSQELFEHSTGVLDTADIERLHDMRVATRRLRAALEIFEPSFPKKPYKRALREVKDLADALGERRDRDVSIAALESFAAAMPAADRPGLRSLTGKLEREQEAANRDLEPHLEERELVGLREHLSELVAAVDA